MERLRQHGAPSPATFQKRFGRAADLRAAFKKWAATRAVPLPPEGRPRKGLPRRDRPRPKTTSPSPRSPSPRPIYGHPLTDGMLLAPTNELGVIHAFGVLAARLGFNVLRIGAAFPDCDALRRIEAGPSPRWAFTRIEFEFRSRNFLAHGHNPAHCDLIVCWEHDWPDSPLEVLELRNEFNRERAQAA